jgi:nucleotide-binding universal stress UspA family protein
VDQALTREAQDRLAQAQAEIQPVRDAELHLREGPPIGRLLDELHAERATVVTVGRPEHTPAAGIGLGSVTTAMLQEAPCSVLIADAGERADGELVVGYDGSGGARRALAVGRELAERLSLTLRVIVATGDAHPPGPGWSRQELGSELLVAEDPRSAVEALINGSRSARLLILGSRHLRGVMALASVSENAALRAHSPVLVVR